MGFVIYKAIGVTTKGAFEGGGRVTNDLLLLGKHHPYIPHMVFEHVIVRNRIGRGALRGRAYGADAAFFLENFFYGKWNFILNNENEKIMLILKRTKNTLWKQY